MAKLAKQYHVAGRPVPFITMWSDERDRHRAAQERQRASSFGPTKKVRFARIGNQDLLVAEDSLGVEQAGGWWWHAPGNARGVGEPLWSQVHAGRHRSCMWKFRCQVCNQQLEAPGRGGYAVRWLISALHPNGVVVDPPTCEPCATTAQRLCPALHRRHTIVQVRAANLRWGVIGTTAVRTPTGLDTQPERFYAADDYGATDTVIARQAAAQLLDYAIETTHG